MLIVRMDVEKCFEELLWTRDWLRELGNELVHFLGHSFLLTFVNIAHVQVRICIQHLPSACLVSKYKQFPEHHMQISAQFTLLYDHKQLFKSSIISLKIMHGLHLKFW